MKRTIAILLEFGFHEIKKYIHSGFAEKLTEHFDIYWLAIDKGNAEFHEYFSSIGRQLIYIDEKQLSSTKSSLESRNQSVRRAWMNNKNLGQFHNYKKVGSQSFKSKLIGSVILKKYFEKRTIEYIKKAYFNNYLVNLFNDLNITDLLFTSNASPFVKSSFICAQTLNINTWYLVNSWKDLYTNNFVPFTKLNGMFVWSEQMKKDYLFHCPYLKDTPIHISGNPTFDVLLNYKPKNELDYYARKYNFNPKATLCYYTLMPPGLVNDEIETVKLVGKTLLKCYSKDQLIILLRKNPNHHKDDFLNAILPENIVKTEHYCEYEKEKDMIVQSQDGETEWLDLLMYSHLNLSVPSTVTLEFTTLGKPVINIGFGPDGKKDERVSQHFEAGFYKPLFNQNNLVFKVDDIKYLIETVKNLLVIKTDKYDIDKNISASKINSIMLSSKLNQNENSIHMQ